MKTFKKILLHIPHSSNARSTELWNDPITFNQNCVRKYTDWHTDIIFASPRPEVESVVFPYSRFYIDVERLENDPLEEKGQGILYTQYEGNGKTFTRVVPEDQRAYMLELYHSHHRKLSEAVEDDTLIIDCHSFPSELSDVDICIGLNDDDTRPDDNFINAIVKIFTIWGYKVAINTPYSNSIAPKTDKSYKSMMIELNKRTYMENLSHKINMYSSPAMMSAIQEVYSLALGLPYTELTVPVDIEKEMAKSFKIGDKVLMTDGPCREGEIVFASFYSHKWSGKTNVEITYLIESQNNFYSVPHEDVLPIENEKCVADECEDTDMRPCSYHCPGCRYCQLFTH